MLLEGLDMAIFGEIEKIESKSFSTPWNAQIYRGFYEKKGSFIFILKNDDVVAAYSLISDMFDSWELLRIAVDSKFRKNGLGKTLMKEIVEFCDKDIFLEVREGNEAAKNLYFSCGFIEIGKRKNYYKDNNEDALILKFEKGGLYEEAGL